MRLPVAIGCAWLAAFVAHAATPPLHDFTWRAPISGSWGNGAMCVVELPDDILSACEAFPLDFRVIDVDGAEWPFIVLPRHDGTTRVAFEARSVGPVWAYAGSSASLMPHYDLRSRGVEVAANTISVTLGPRERNPARKLLRLHEYRQWLLTLAAVMIVLFAGIAALNRLRHRA